MKKEKKHKTLKKIIKLITLVVIVCSFGFLANYFVVTAGTALSDDNLTKAVSSPTIKVYDNNNSELNITSISSNYIKIENLKPHTIDAFLTSEDRSFYSHHGIDYKRVAGALINNIKSKKLKQGGSTISQQLIKNTHLSSEKTLDRKLKEFKLTKQLESKYSKNQILELYLNTIYFGNGKYGIENASYYYFGKSSSDLSISESAILAGIISSPSYNEPINHYEKSNAKKEIILKNMQKLGKITENQYKNALNEDIIISKQSSNPTNQFIKSVISNTAEILHLTENQIRNKEIKIYTSIDTNLDNFCNSIVNNLSFSPKNDKDIIPLVQSIVIDNNSSQVVSYACNKSSNVENLKRQPGSAIKPLLVYAPAFEFNKITPSSFILDEQTKFGEYSPKNSNDKYTGWTTIRSSIEKSLNVPAVKTLSYVGIDKAKNFVSKMNINLDENDNHLAIALGGLTYGTTIKELADAYSSFSNSGFFSESSFITKIVDNKNRTLYEYKPIKKPIMSEETAYMITDTLVSTVKNGTAKKLQIDGIEIASKTGTTNNNKDAWNVCYTTNHTIVTYIGNLDNSALNNSINGSTYPTLINREILKKLYEENVPQSFNIPDGIVKANLEKEDLDNIKNKLSLDQITPSKSNEIYTKDTLPNFNYGDNIILKYEVKNIQNQSPIIKIYTKNTEKLTIFKQFNNKTVILKEFSNPSNNIEINDPDTQSGNIYTYYIKAENNSKSLTSEKIKIKIY